MSGSHQCPKRFLAGTNTFCEKFHSFERTTPVDPRRVMYQAYKAQVLQARESLMFHQFIFIFLVLNVTFLTICKFSCLNDLIRDISRDTT